MKQITLAFAFVLTSVALTNAVHAAPRPVSSNSLGLATWQWNETLTVTDGGTQGKDAANLNALVLQAQTETYYHRWGWSMSAFAGSGRATGGGKNFANYQASKVPFTVLGIAPRGFYRLTGRVNMGFSAIAYTRNMSWPTDTATQEVNSGLKMNVTGMADLTLRLSRSIEFYQGVGPLAEKSTIWRLGLNYRF